MKIGQDNPLDRNLHVDNSREANKTLDKSTPGNTQPERVDYCRRIALGAVSIASVTVGALAYYFNQTNSIPCDDFSPVPSIGPKI